MIKTEHELPRGFHWQAARTACRDEKERERLSAAYRSGWSAHELYEYARTCHHRPGKEVPTAHSFRQALAHLNGISGKQWLELFRALKAPLPPLTAQELKYTPDKGGITNADRYWPFHPPELITMIDARARAYFAMPDWETPHPNAWRASYWAHLRALPAEAKAAAKALKPPRPPRPPKPKVVHPPHFYRDWPGHTAEFIAEIDRRAEDYWRARGLSADGRISEEFWRWRCQQETIEGCSGPARESTKAIWGTGGGLATKALSTSLGEP